MAKVYKEAIYQYVKDEEFSKIYWKLDKYIVRCKDCKYFELDHFDTLDGIPIITSHEVCTKWGRGCKTSQNGYCFMAERKEE